MPVSSKTPSHLALPVEIWELIFEFATYVPYALEPYIGYVADFIGTTELKERCESALKDPTRRYLPLVCKTWYGHSIRFLYQSIDINLSNLDTAASLASLLQSRNPQSRSNVRKNKKHLDLGAYTQRIDVSFSAQLPGKMVALGWSHLTDIIDSLPNLSIVVFHDSCQVDPAQINSFVLAFMSICRRPTLKVFDWSNCLIRLSPYQLRILLSHANLRHLSCFSLTLPSNSEIPLASNTLTTLSFRSSDPDEGISSRRISLPALRNLISPGSRPPGRFWRSLLRTCGPGLVSVCFAPPRVYTEGAFQGDVDLVARACPNPQRLTLTIKTGYDVPEHLEIPPVRVLGIQFTAEHVSEPSLRFLGHVLTGVCRRTPTLERIQFFADPTGLQGTELGVFMESFSNLPLVNIWEGGSSGAYHIPDHPVTLSISYDCRRRLTGTSVSGHTI